MSHDEMDKLHLRLDQIYKDIVTSIEAKEKEHQAQHKIINESMDKISEQNKRQFQMLEPMYKIFKNVSGFNSISVWILKGLALLGAGLGVVYALIKWLRA